MGEFDGNTYLRTGGANTTGGTRMRRRVFAAALAAADTAAVRTVDGSSDD